MKTMAKMVHKVGKYTRAGHKAHTKLRGGNPLTQGGNWRRGSGGGRSGY